MPDSATGGEEVDVVVLGEPFDRRVLLQIRWSHVLDIMVEREDGLARVVDLRRADRGEFGDDRARVVVSGLCEHGERAETHVMTCLGEMVTNSPEYTRVLPGGRSTACRLTICSMYV